LDRNLKHPILVFPDFQSFTALRTNLPLRARVFIRSHRAHREPRRPVTVTSLFAASYGLEQEPGLRQFWSADCVLSVRIIFDIGHGQHG